MSKPASSSSSSTESSSKTNPLRRGRADPGHQLHHPESSDAVARIFDEAQQRQHVLDVGGLQEFEPAELHERNVAAGEFHFERSAMVRGAKQDRLLFQRGAAFAVLQHAARHGSNLAGPFDWPGYASECRPA